MANSIAVHFRDLPDPRRAQGRRHCLADMLVIAVTAVICAADSWSDVRDFGRAKLKWFKTFLNLPHGIPSQDTFERVFSRLDPEPFERCFLEWTAALSGSSGGQLLVIDGQRLRRSFEQAWTQSTATHLVNACATAQATVFVQWAVDAKENELVAIPRLLELLDLHGATVTSAARGGQTVAGDHGRIETRRVWTTPQIDWLGDERHRWAGLRSVAVVETTRDVPLKGVSRERRYYISTFAGADAPRMAAALRGHWGIENRLHYVLDVAFGEDQSRVRRGHAAENFSRSRRIALNLLRRETSRRRGIKGKRLNAAWDHDYLLKLLTG